MTLKVEGIKPEYKKASPVSAHTSSPRAEIHESEVRGALRRLRALVGIAGLLVLATFIGCGGGGSNSNPSAGGTTGGGSFTTAQRLAALDAINQTYQTVADQDIQTQDQTLLTFIKSRREFEASGISESGGVWARFTDGRMLCICNNRPSTAAPLTKKPTTRAVEVPDAGSGVRLMVDGADLSSDTVNKLATAFTGLYKGTARDATLDNLRQCKDVSVFYLDTHSGSVFTRDGTKVTALETSTTVGDTSTSGPDLATDFENNAVGFMMAPGIFNPAHGNVQKVLTNHYFITPQFVLTRMSFVPHSMVFINACQSANANSIDVQNAAFHQGAGGFIGWTKEVDDGDAQQTALYLFDRLLGERPNINLATQESPPQRPFDLDRVYGEMKTRSRGNKGYALAESQASVLYSFINSGLEPKSDGNTSRLIFAKNITSGAGSGIMLTPSIQYVNVDEQKRELHISGDFGSDPGTDGSVTVGGSPMTIKSGGWTQSEVVVQDLPVSGAGSAGDVVVSVHQYKSNAVPLTSWRGTVTWTQTGPDNVTASVQVRLHFRKDVHGYRAAPGMAPVSSPTTDEIAPDTVATYVSGGSATFPRSPGVPDLVLSIGGSGQLSFQASGTTGSYVTGGANIQPTSGSTAGLSPGVPLQLDLNVFGLANNAITITSSDPGPPAMKDLRFGIVLGNAANGDLKVGDLILPLNSDYSITGGSNSDTSSLVVVTDGVTAGKVTTRTMTWSNITPDPGTAPTNQTLRSAARSRLP
jgi:hypothetical protein